MLGQKEVELALLNLPTASRPGSSSTSGSASTTPKGHTRHSNGKTPAEAYRSNPPVDMMDKLLRALSTPSQAQQQRQADLSKEILAV